MHNYSNIIKLLSKLLLAVPINEATFIPFLLVSSFFSLNFSLSMSCLDCEEVLIAVCQSIRGALHFLPF